MEKYNAYVEKHRQLILDTNDHIWKNPESGYREWKTHQYLADIFEKLGYTITPAGNIPGFIADLETGRAGPTVAVFAELDALIIPEHPDADPETGAVHACGHCAQCAALVGIAAALKEPGALDDLSGKIRLVAVPAEEMIEIDYRLGLRSKGMIKYLGGKPEFLHRGLLDGVDLCFMIHTLAGGVSHVGTCNGGSNGLIAKTITFEGVSAHAGGSPHKGINALYAANLALNAINSLRETFQDKDHIRVHPIITFGGGSVNAIPDKVTVESYVRGANMEAIAAANEKINRAISASAAAMGAKVQINDMPGYWPRNYTPDYVDVFRQAAENSGVTFEYSPSGWSSGCSDLGDMCAVMPAIHPNMGGSTGKAHGVDYQISDPESACVDSAKWQVQALGVLLANGGEKAKAIVANYAPTFSTFAEYFAYVDNLNMDKQTVAYDEAGNVTLNFHK